MNAGNSPGIRRGILVVNMRKFKITDEDRVDKYVKKEVCIVTYKSGTMGRPERLGKR